MLIDTEHAALLRGIAKNLKDATACRVYSDWLQERGSPGWFVTAHYPIECWAVWLNPERETARRRKATKRYYETEKPAYLNEWSLPWIDGTVEFATWDEQWRARVKKILLAYADGRAT